MSNRAQESGRKPSTRTSRSASAKTTSGRASARPSLFAGKTVVVFSLPGAFTPTCSSTHLPRYNELAPAFHANGVDSILCVSVNDTFVMNEWAKDQEADNVVLVPDGNGEFTEGMGMLVDKTDLGFGKRSWRYSMLVKDGVVQKMFIEPQKPGDPFEVSDADTMLAVHQPDGEAAGPGRDLHARRLPVLRTRQDAAQRARLRVRRGSAAAYHAQQSGRRDGRRKDSAAGLHQRQADRRSGATRKLGPESRVTPRAGVSPALFQLECTCK